MSLQVLQSYHAIAYGGLSTSFGATGGTAPYTFSVVPGGAGGTIDGSTGIYVSPPSILNTGEDEILVTDSGSTPATASATILVCSQLELVCDIIQTAMGLSQGQVYLWDQKINIPTDERLYVVVGVQSCKPFGNRPKYVGGSGSFAAAQTVNMLATLSIDILSRGPAARDLKEQVLLAMSSPYSAQQQELNSFYLATLPTSLINLSHIDGAAIPYRFQFLANIQYFSTLVTTPSYFDNVGSFTVVTDPEQHPPPSLITILLDNFHGVNGTLLENHTPDLSPGSPWVHWFDAAQIQNNEVTKVSQIDPGYYIDAGVSFGILEVHLDLNATDQQVNFYLGNAGGPQSTVGYLFNANPSIGTVTIADRFWVQYASGSYVFVSGPQVWKFITASDGSIYCYINDVLVLQATGLTTGTDTNWGFELYNPANTTLQQFKISVPA